jgi:hypothetical protein
MKKMTFIVCAMLVLLLVIPVQAAQHRTTGEQIDIYESGEQEFPANTAFYIAHGWQFDKGLSIGLMEFSLDVDGDEVSPTYIDNTQTTLEDNNHMWVFNFPEGMTGVHTFTGHWTGQCNTLLRYGLVSECSHPTARIDMITSEVVVTFTE